MRELYDLMSENNELDIFMDIDGDEEYKQSLFHEIKSNQKKLSLKSNTLTFIYRNKNNIQECLKKNPKKYAFLQHTGHI